MVDSGVFCRFSCWRIILSWVKLTVSLKALPSLQRKGIIVVEFKAENNGRKRKHQHLFMMDEEAKAVPAGDSSLKPTVSKVPIEDWTALLESGWGSIEGTHFFYA